MNQRQPNGLVGLVNVVVDDRLADGQGRDARREGQRGADRYVIDQGCGCADGDAQIYCDDQGRRRIQRNGDGGRAGVLIHAKAAAGKAHAAAFSGRLAAAHHQAAARSQR